MTNQYHKLVYAEDILILNAENAAGGSSQQASEEKATAIESKTETRTETEAIETIETTNIPNAAKLFAIALPPGSSLEVTRMETDRAVIFNAVREGFAAAYDR